MIRDTQIGRMILEAVTGIHGDVARDVAQAWVTLSEQNQRLQSHIVELESRLELPENGKCDGIYCREQTIAAQDEIIGDLCKKDGLS